LITWMQVTFGTLMAIGFLASPIMLAWGWIRFAKLPRLGTVGSVLSLIGLILATASAALAVSSIGYAVVIRGFPYYDPRLMRIFRRGTFLSLGGIVLGTGGIGKRTSPRWHVPVSAVCMFVFWIVAAEGE
jgi:O-antigen ligase